ncbi:DUF2267 family protein [Natrialba magadii ATCC 43099]|uniref:DUF2267 family protein n=1 Tax=Natrialba magadii (strain ATCC 43099 / DSM 3394 / CCM 3739 / CIP 104546 / IAM 13178 / JCM 8861 / NBRC 102185 / NCIMB 2190 / MS3) TaxID=547559 RepID=D3SZ99_NATMM|nr:DUF2267 domain-containing protein [Natrialba magadii]ADD04233.1 DUF2267 family protein [Natrialba magadii ATCC 43099]ELY26635.1 hypothetical protein C500_15780 [Natrialba magadii ATCC 43099]
MQYDDFIGEVQHGAQLDSREAALSISRATLTTLSERIQPGEAENLGAQLPAELGRFLEDVDDVERFEFEEFITRVSERSQVGEGDPADATFHAQIVMEVVTEAVDPGAIDDVRDQLPADEGYADLFELAEQEESPR